MGMGRSNEKEKEAGLHRKKNCRRKRRKRGMFWARVCVMRKSDMRSNNATA
jgi:hypothetical protein